MLIDFSKAKQPIHRDFLIEIFRFLKYSLGMIYAIQDMYNKV